MTDPQRRQVFISYSRRDQVFARRLFDGLNQISIESWADWEDIPISAAWWEEIQRGIENSDAFLCVLSPSYMASEICNKEILYARQLNKRIIPLMRRPWREKGEPLEELIGDKAWGDLILENEQAISRLNYVFFRKKKGFNCTFNEFGKVVDPACDGVESDFDEFGTAFQLLIDAVQKDPAHLSEHTRLTIRAAEWEQNQHNPHFLLRGDDLRRAENWLLFGQNQTPLPSPVQQAYIQAAIHARIQEEQAERERQARELTVQRQSVNRLRYLVGALLIFLVIAAFLTNIATSNEARAVSAQATQERVALESQSLAWSANARAASIDNQNMVALPLALEAVSIPSPPALSQQIFAEIAYQPNVVMRYAAGNVWSFDLSPQGDLLITGDNEGRVMWWDVRDGRLLKDVTAESEYVKRIGFSPDGAYAFSAQSHLVIVWDVATQEERYRFDTTGLLSFVDISPDSQFILISELGMTATQWSLLDGSRVTEWQANQMTIGETQAIFSPDGKYLAMQTDAEILAWDRRTGQQLFAINAFRSGMSLDLKTIFTYSPDGTALLGIANDENSDDRIVLWNALTGKVIHFYEGHTDFINELAFSPDGKTFASASNDNTVMIWSVSTGELLHRFIGHTDTVETVAFSPDGVWLASGAWDNSVILWDVENRRLVYRFADQTSPVVQVKFIQNRPLVFSSGDEQGVLARDFSSATLIHQYADGGGQFTFSPDGQFILDTGLRVWDVDQQGLAYQLPQSDSLVNDVAFSPDGRYALSGDETGLVTLWNLETKSVWRVFDKGGIEVTSLAFNPDGQTIAVGYANGSITLWDVNDASEIVTLTGHDGWVYQVDFSPDGRLLASGAGDNLVKLWDLTDRRDIHTWNIHQSNVIAVAFSPDGQYVLSGSWDKTLALFDVKTYEVVQVYRAHTDAITHAVFSPDGQFMMSAADDERILLWDVLSGQILREYDGGEFVRGFAIAPNGKSFAFSIANEVVGIWIRHHRLDTLNELISWVSGQRLVRELTCEERQQYQTMTRCDGDARFPTRTPYPVDTQVPSATPDTSMFIPLSSPTPTPTTTPTYQEVAPTLPRPEGSGSRG